MADTNFDHLAASDVDQGAPLWMVSFADMSLLLQCFFIMLLTKMKDVEIADQDILRILASIKAGFGYVPEESSDPLDQAVLQVLSRTDKGRMDSNNKWTSPAIAGSKVGRKDVFGWARAPFGRAVYFRTNSAVIEPVWTKELEEIAELVRHHYREIVIQGHCSKKEAKSDRASGGHDIAFQRALAVKKRLQAFGVASMRLRIVTCGPHDKYKNETEPVDRERVVVMLGTYYLPNGEKMLNIEPRASTLQ